MKEDEIKQQAIEILQDIIDFWQPPFAEAILIEFENRLKKI